MSAFAAASIEGPHEAVASNSEPRTQPTEADVFMARILAEGARLPQARRRSSRPLKNEVFQRNLLASPRKQGLPKKRRRRFFSSLLGTTHGGDGGGDEEGG